VLSVKQCAKRAGVCESVVRGWVATGKLPHYRLGLKRGKITVAIEDLDALLATFRVTGRASSPALSAKPARLKHLRMPS
jgi:excisionase family DNA binding protein